MSERVIPSLADAEQEARRARESLRKLEQTSGLIREGKRKAEPDFYENFGKAYTSVRVAEYAVNLAREKERREREEAQHKAQTQLNSSSKRIAKRAINAAANRR